MTVTDTSLLAYIKLKASGKLQPLEQKVYDVLFEYPDGLSNSEIENLTGIKINSVTARVFALRKKDKVEFAEKRTCRVTRELVNTWRIKND